MKKFNILFFILSIPLLASISSCKKYLDKKPTSSLVTPSTVADLQALLDAIDYMNYNTSGYSVASDDDYFLLDATYNSRSENERNTYRWISFDYNYPNDWSAAYYSVYVSNLCLEKIEAISGLSQDINVWNNVKGSALFIRAYYFLSLVWAHAKAYDNNTAQNDLGIPLRLGSDFNVSSQRASVRETYDRIIADAKNALDFLPDNPQHVLRPSKAAAYGLLARTYLSMRQYDSALKYSNLCLQIKNQLLDLKNPSININSSAPFSAYNVETIFFSRPYRFVLAPYQAFGLVDSSLYSKYSNNDLRKTAFFSPKSGYYFFKANYTGSNFMFTGIAVDEMYLTRAECYARTGDKTSALKDLNTLLEKRYNATFVPVIATDINDALNKILTERRKELLFRGLRWIDIKRLNKEGANITLKRIVGGQTYTLPPNDDRYALPLPKDIIDQAGIQQN
jgi:hypothetical protein